MLLKYNKEAEQIGDFMVKSIQAFKNMFIIMRKLWKKINKSYTCYNLNENWNKMLYITLSSVQKYINHTLMNCGNLIQNEYSIACDSPTKQCKSTGKEFTAILIKN